MNEKTNGHDQVLINGETETDIVGKEKMNKRLRNALYRVGGAFLAAIILLAITKFSFIDLINGPKETVDTESEEIGAFVKTDVYAIIGYYADQNFGDTIVGEYALAPMNGKYVTVHFTKRYLESAGTVLSDTNNYLNGTLGTLDNYMIVQGTVEKLDEEHSTQMYEWFAQNADWMLEKQVITSADDYATYLTDTIITVDTVNSLNQNVVFALTGLAALCVLYILVELILMATGFYLSRSKKKSEIDTTNEEISSVAALEDEAHVETVSEDSVLASDSSEEEIRATDSSECIKEDLNPENIVTSDTTQEESSEKPEEK